MNIAANRVVAVLTPAVFAPLAGAISVLAADTAGIKIGEGELTAIFIAGATIAFGKAGLWLKGWQDFEKGQQAMPADAFHSANDVAGLEDEDEPAIDDEDDEFEAVAPEDEAVESVDEFEEPDFGEEPEPDEEPEVQNGADSHLVAASNG
jgi:hypothetical protein